MDPQSPYIHDPSEHQKESINQITDPISSASTERA